MSGPWEDYAPAQTSAPAPPTASQGPWADYADPSAAPPAAAPNLGFSDSEKHLITHYIAKAKDGPDLEAYARKLTNGRVGISNAKDVVQYYRDYNKVPNSFVDNAEGTDTEPVTPGMYAKDALAHAGHGFMSALGFVDDAVLDPILNVGDLVKKPLEIYHDIVNPPSKEQLKARIADEQAKNSRFTRAAGDFYDRHVADTTAPARNTQQRYLNNVSEFAGGSAVPMGEFNGVRGVAGLATGAVTGGVLNQAAKDAGAPEVVQDLAGLVGAHVGATPFALKPLRENSYVNRNGGMTPSAFDPTGTAPHPEAASVAEAAQALTAKAKDVSPDGLTPKGRGQLTVTQINRVGLKPLIGIRRGIARLVSAGHLDKQDASKLSDAITNRDGITKDEIDGLRGTVAGDATADALQHYRAVQNLTKPYGGDGRGIGSKAWNTLVKVSPIPKLIADVITVKPGDVNASRIRGADKAIDNASLYQRLGDKTGPTGLQNSHEVFNDTVKQTYTDEEAASQASAADAQAKADAKAEADMKARSVKSQTQAFKDAAKKAKDRQAVAEKAIAGNFSGDELRSVKNRERKAYEAIQSDPVLPKQPERVGTALDAYKKATKGAAQKLVDFDTKLNTPPEAPKASVKPMDKAVQANIEAGIEGNYNSYADTLGVKREDVHRALKTVKTDDVDPFEVQKLVHGYKLSPAGRAALIPRLQKALTEDGTIAARAKEAEAPAAVPKTPTKSGQAPAAETGLNYKNVKRVANHNAGRARFQANFDRTVNDHAMQHDGPILSDAATGIQYMRDTAKTTDAAMEYFDTHLGPKLRNKGYEPEEIDHLREALHEASTVGKPYRTQAELEKEAMTKGPGRPKKPKPSDDVPF